MSLRPLELTTRHGVIRQSYVSPITTLTSTNGALYSTSLPSRWAR
jgi:hypothetical protein